jgi:hypothetical protein
MLKRIRRNPTLRQETRRSMMESLAAEVKAREVKELADKIGIGKTRQRRKKVV